MISLLVAAWVGLLALLVKLGVIKWTKWWKMSPIVIFVVAETVLILPMNFGAPTGPTVVLRESIQISAAVSGIVTEVRAGSETSVKQGDVLFRLDPTPYQARVDELTSSLDLSKTRVSQAEKLVERGAGPVADVQRYTAESGQLEAQLDGARFELEQTTIKAPTDGFLGPVALLPGTYLPAGKQVMVLFDTSDQFVVVQIEQAFLRHIQVGQAAELILKLYPGDVFDAKVTQILQVNAAGQLTPAGVPPEAFAPKAETYLVRIECADPDLVLPAGAAGTAAIFTNELGASHVFRKVVLRMDGWKNYIMP